MARRPRSHSEWKLSVSTYISSELRHRLVRADGNRCAYCRTSELCSGLPLVIDHILPRSRSGLTEFENICFACYRCNEFKGAATHSDASETASVRLFHPRLDAWEEHFCWSPDGIHIDGLTEIGQASVLQLNMNNAIIVAARKRWVFAGWHPPDC